MAAPGGPRSTDGPGRPRLDTRAGRGRLLPSTNLWAMTSVHDPLAPPTTDRFGTPGASGATRVMLLGSGELGKEVAIALQRLGVEVIAVDRYDGAPAHQVAHRAHTIDMTDGDAIRRVV